MSSDCCLHQVIQLQLGFQIFEVDSIVAPATNLISELFPWLALHRLHKACLAVHQSCCMQYSFFHKSKLIFKTCLLKSPKNVSSENF